MIVLNRASFKWISKSLLIIFDFGKVESICTEVIAEFIKVVNIDWVIDSSSTIVEIVFGREEVIIFGIVEDIDIIVEDNSELIEEEIISVKVVGRVIMLEGNVNVDINVDGDIKDVEDIIKGWVDCIIGLSVNDVEYNKLEGVINVVIV